MPQDVAVPTWYIDNQYISEKVDECNTIKFGAVEGQEFTPWTPETVRTFIAGVNDSADYAPWMGYDNFVSNGNAENCSPNPLFNVMQYVYAKAAQLNAMNDGAGYGVNANNWTGQLVLDYFKANNISAWDHFTTAGQFENVNPSNALDLSEFLTKKAAQCNAEEFDGKSDWTPESVLEYYRDNGLNAVEVAVSANDPNVVAVPAAEAVTVPTNLNPWGTEGPLNVVNLTTGPETVTDEGVPTNFVGTVETSNTKSTFNPDDQITGTSNEDVLTVAMNSSFNGMNKDGFVTGVDTVDLSTTIINGNPTFDATGVKGVQTWNIDGNISLDNLDITGTTVNLSNVNNSEGLTIDYAAEAAAAPDDALTLGVKDVYVPAENTDQPSTPVAINSSGIENLTVVSTGTHLNRIGLSGVDYMKALTIKGDAALDIANVDPNLATIDGSEATGALAIGAQGAKITSALLGEGSDNITVNNILPSATVDGGDGEDNLTLSQTRGTFNFDMSNVETVTIQANTADITLNGADIEGMSNLKLDNTNSIAANGVIPSHNVYMTNFEDNDLKVQAIWDNDNTDLTNAEISNVSIRVGDGDSTTTDHWIGGQITLGSAGTLAIDATDTYDKAATFNNQVDAASVTNLVLNAGTRSALTVAQDSDLSSLTHIDASGTGRIILDANSALGVNSRQINVNTTQMDNGSFSAVFQNHANGNGQLDVKGTTMASNNITVDSSYTKVNMQTGMGNDSLTVVATYNPTTGTSSITTSSLTGNLGGGNNILVVHGDARGANFTKVDGVSQIVFTDPDAALGQWTFNDSNDPATIWLPTGIGVNDPEFRPEWNVDSRQVNWPGTPGNDEFNVAVNEGDVQTYNIGGNGGSDSIIGYVDSELASININGRNTSVPAAQDTGTIHVDFGPDTASQFDVMAVKDISITGGPTLANSFTGSVANVEGNFSLTTGTGRDIVNLASVEAGNNITINAQSRGDKSFGNVANGVATGGLNAGGAVQFQASGQGDVMLGNVLGAAAVVLGGTLSPNGTLTAAPLNNDGSVTVGDITSDTGIAYLNTGGEVTTVGTGNIQGASVQVALGNTEAVDLGTITAQNVRGVAGTVSITGGADIVGDVTIAGVEKSTTTTVNLNNDGNVTFTNGIIANDGAGTTDVSITTGSNVDVLNTGNITAGVAADGADPAVQGQVAIAVANGSVQIGNVETNGGTFSLAGLAGALSANVSTVTINSVNAADTTIDATGITGAAKLNGGNAGKLTFTGGDGDDVIGAQGATVKVGADTNISTGDGNDTINVVTSGINDIKTVTINTGDSTGTDTVNVTASNELATKITTVDITGGTGKDVISVTTGENNLGGTIFTIRDFSVAEGDSLDVDLGAAFASQTATSQSFMNPWFGIASLSGSNLSPTYAAGNTNILYVRSTNVSAAQYEGIYATTNAASSDDASLIRILGTFDNTEIAAIVNMLTA